MKISKVAKALILFYLFIATILVVGGIFIYNNHQYHKEVQACIRLHDDPTVDIKIRLHCKQVYNEWKAERAAEIVKENQKYLDSVR